MYQYGSYTKENETVRIDHDITFGKCDEEWRIWINIKQETQLEKKNENFKEFRNIDLIYEHFYFFQVLKRVNQYNVLLNWFVKN